MSKRPISYTIPTTPERPAKRRQVSSSSFSGYQQAPEPMDLDEVTSTLKRKVGNAPDGRGSNKYIAPTTWARTVEDLGIPEPNSKGFVHPYVAPKGEKRNAPEYSPTGSIINPTRGERPSKQSTPMSWEQQVQDLGIPEPDRQGFRHPYIPPEPKQEVVVGIPEPSTSGYKMSTNYNRMAGTQYKYLHIDSTNRLTHETNSKVTVNFGGLPIENIKRVGVLKATITNTGHNIFSGHDQVKIGVRIGANHVFATLTLDHDYYTIADMVTALNTKLQAYTNATSAFQTAVRDLVFSVGLQDLITLATKVSPATPSGTAVSYALIADHTSDRANTLFYELGFDKTSQTLDPGRYTDYLNGDFLPSHAGLILPSQNFNGRLMYLYGGGTPIHNGHPNIRGFHRFTSENTKGFYLCSSALTAGGNILKAQVSGDGRATVQHDDHLVFIPNKALRDEYNQYETNVIEWVDVYGDLQTFDLEVRNHLDKPLSSTNISASSASPPFMTTLIFECEADKAVSGTDTMAYHREAYREAHQQN